MAQVLVLGARFAGPSTALLLARDGHQVTVVEREQPEALKNLGPNTLHAS